jgi:hypothetical protein
MSKEYSYSDARKRAAEHEREFDSFALKLPKNMPLFRVKKPGVIRLDIMPYVAAKGNPHADEGMLHYERTYFIHGRVGPDQIGIVCPRETADLEGKRHPCPICEMQRTLKMDPQADDKLIKSLYPRERQIFQIIDVENPDAGIQLWDMSYHLFGRLLDARIRDQDEQDAFHLFYHLKKGFTLKIGFVEESANKRVWYKAETIDFKTREPYGTSMLEQCVCLDELIKLLPTAEIEAALEGGERSGSGDQDQRQPARGRGPDGDQHPAGRGRGTDDERPTGRGRDADQERRPAAGRGRGTDEPPAGRGRGTDEERPTGGKSEEDFFNDDAPGEARPRGGRGEDAPGSDRRPSPGSGRHTPASDGEDW